MKIIFNTDQTFLHGGIEKTMATKANYFVNIPNVHVYIVTTEQNGKLPCYFLDARVTLIDLGINYDRRLSYLSKRNLKKTFQHFRRQYELYKILQPDVVISANFNFDHYWLPFLLSKVKVIKERHGSRFFEDKLRKNTSFLNRLKFAFNNWLDSKYSHIVVLNEDEKKYVKSNNAVVIPNSVCVPEYKAELKNKTVIAAGRISPVKAFDELIQAWKVVYDNFPDWQLHIYGDDYLDTGEKLSELIGQLELQDVISFKESVKDLPYVMQHYSIYAMSSITECFPMVLLEALSVGLPIVSYDCPNGPRNIIRDKEDGLLAEYRNKRSLAEKLLELINDENKRLEMGNSAKINVQRFNNDRVMELWCNLLNLQHV
ncbi:glycosyltransferase [Epilithonimonas ginsengisoli]|uniref:Glycosyltransferase n=1 Tax=Epilithonimonas ginsengisoli TaxID=1245592 RepID=A0ABU4JIR8_9FLAO|nr:MULTISPECIES: glycosyltransferase [Chryseobacterium group]MBV6879077.1 glycosyltransferase [Epilithonimonas sp. FP105]MDW8549512.1 glycosyltransferase [Epilithonimonas ginsengisoli]OAH74376.1 hypothetical protein AXA65_06340 [Chryseobacterium sp. FP211-J200]